MKTLIILALLVTACAGSVAPPASGPCPNVNCVKHPADKDAR